MRKSIIIISALLVISFAGLITFSVLFFYNQHQLEKDNEELKNKDELLKEKEVNLNDLKKKLSNSEEEVKNLEASITNRDKKIKEQKKKLKEKNKSNKSASNKKSKEDAENKVKEALNVPKEATCDVIFGETYYWEGAGITLRHVMVEGTGKYKGYYAEAGFNLDYSEACTSICPWTKMWNQYRTKHI